MHAGEAYMLWLTCWMVFLPCFAHNCHNGLKWSLLSFFADKSCLRPHRVLEKQHQLTHEACWDLGGGEAQLRRLGQ
eukprot:15448365-Alexandrium_andersonii.AAC.1